MMRCKTITHLSCCSVCAWSNCNRSECRRWDTPCNQCFHGSLSTNSGGSEQSAAWCGKHDGDDCCCYWAVWSLGRGSMMASSVEKLWLLCWQSFGLVVNGAELSGWEVSVIAKFLLLFFVRGISINHRHRVKDENSSVVTRLKSGCPTSFALFRTSHFKNWCWCIRHRLTSHNTAAALDIYCLNQLNTQANSILQLPNLPHHTTRYTTKSLLRLPSPSSTLLDNWL